MVGKAIGMARKCRFESMRKPLCVCVKERERERKLECETSAKKRLKKEVRRVLWRTFK